MDFAIRARAFKLMVQRHCIVTATLALQPSLRTHYHGAEVTPKPTVSAAKHWLCVRGHQVAVDLNRLLSFWRFRRFAEQLIQLLWETVKHFGVPLIFYTLAQIVQFLALFGGHPANLPEMAPVSRPYQYDSAPKVSGR